MVPGEYRDFMLAVVGASASFIGLLFVALSVVIPNLDLKVANRERHLAISAYAAFLNVFFLSLVALLPTHHAFGIVALVLGLSGLTNTFSQVRLAISRVKRKKSTSLIFVIPLMTIIYGFEFYFGIRALQTQTAEVMPMVVLMLKLILYLSLNYWLLMV